MAENNISGITLSGPYQGLIWCILTSEGYCLIDTFLVRVGSSLLFCLLRSEGHCLIGAFLAHFGPSFLICSNYSICFSKFGPLINSQRTRPHTIFDFRQRKSTITQQTFTMSRYAESGVPSSGVDVTMLQELLLHTREARREDVGAMANVFIRSFRHDQTAQLLYPHDSIWPEVVEMIKSYLLDDYTYLVLAEDEYTDTIVGWTSVSLVASGEDDYFKYCDSTVWAGRQLLRKEARARGEAPVPMDEMKRAALISKLREHNRNGQNRHASGNRLVINTIAMDPDVFETEIQEVAYRLIDHIRDVAKRERLPLWVQVPKDSLGDLEELYGGTGFAQVGSFELDLSRYTSEENRRRSNWRVQKWTQWVLRVGNWERGR